MFEGGNAPTVIVVVGSTFRPLPQQIHLLFNFIVLHFPPFSFYVIVRS